MPSSPPPSAPPLLPRARWARAARRAAIVALLPILPLAALALHAATLPPLDLAAARDHSAAVTDRDGRLLRAFVTADGRWRLPAGPGDVDPRYLAMLAAYEDRRFDAHPGVDPLAIARAVLQMARSGRVVSGGSTLTMQVARLLEPRRERSGSAKLRQVARALDLERRLTKAEILELYLRLAPFGGNLEGVRAASLAYLAKEPKRLSTAEAALLVALPQSPETRRPDRFPEAARAARDRVLARAEAAGLVSPAERAAAEAEPVPEGRRPFPALAPHAAEQALQERPGERLHRLTLDARLQASLEALARERAAALGPALSVAIVAADNATGEVRALVGGVDHLSQERAGALDLTQALRSPGSALKPFVYALAFDSGLAHPETVLEDRPSRYGLYAPENFDLTFQGTVTARRALQLSLNVPAVELLAQVGPARFLARLRDAGAAVALPKDAAPSLAVGLGGLGLTLRDMTGLYLALARGGEVAPLALRAATAPEPAPPRRLAEPVAAWYVADILLGAPPPAHAPGGRVAYKTGTSYGYRDAWALGFDGRHTIGVWVGRADNGAVPGLTGRLAAAPILFDAFARAGPDPAQRPPPPGAIAAGAVPPPLRHLRQDVPKTVAALGPGPLRVAFPPDGARVELDGSAGEGALALKATGGAPPFTWLVNGAPALPPTTRREAQWTPGSRGFLRITVMDAQGASDSVEVRLP